MTQTYYALFIEHGYSAKDATVRPIVSLTRNRLTWRTARGLRWIGSSRVAAVYETKEQAEAAKRAVHHAYRTSDDPLTAAMTAAKTSSGYINPHEFVATSS